MVTLFTFVPLVYMETTQDLIKWGFGCGGLPPLLKVFIKNHVINSYRCGFFIPINIFLRNKNAERCTDNRFLQFHTGKGLQNLMLWSNPFCSEDNCSTFVSYVFSEFWRNYSVNNNLNTLNSSCVVNAFDAPLQDKEFPSVRSQVFLFVFICITVASLNAFTLQMFREWKWTLMYFIRVPLYLHGLRTHFLSYLHLNISGYL